MVLKIPLGCLSSKDWSQAFDDLALAASIWHIIEPANEQNLNRLHAMLAKA